VERLIFIEVLDRRGELLRRERLSVLPFRIGRGYDNELILDDPHVCAAHAVIERAEDGSLVLRDLGSLNGLRELPGRERRASLPLASGASALLGRSVLRVRDASHQTPPALRLRAHPRWLEWSLNHWAAAFVWIALLGGATVLQLLRSATQEIDWVEQATGFGMTVVLAAFWAGAWALLGRLLGQPTRFVAHLAITVAVVLASMLQDRLFLLGQFLIEGIEALQIVDHVLDGVLLALLIFGHLTLLRVGRPLRRRAAAALVGLALLAFELGSQYTKRVDWVAVLPYWSRLEPIAVELLPVEPLDGFFVELKGIEPELAELREELLEEEE
jgi:hypothetical protein